MHIQTNEEWWKMKVYNEVSQFLKHPNQDQKRNLQTALLKYEEIFNRILSTDVNAFNDLEVSMNEM